MGQLMGLISASISVGDSDYVQSRRNMIETQFKTEIESVNTSNNCSLDFTIHQAAGMLGLLKSSNLSSIDESDALFYVTVDVFPQNISSPTSDIIVTKPYKPFFAPVFAFSTKIEIKNIDSTMVSWLKKDGKAVGKIWVSFSRIKNSSESDNDICIGTFFMPLNEVILYHRSIREEWFPVGDSSQGAIKCSVSFREDNEIYDPERSIYSVINDRDQRVLLHFELTCLSLKQDEILSPNSVIMRWKIANDDWIISDELPLNFVNATAQFFGQYSRYKNIALSDLKMAKKIEVEFYVAEPTQIYIGSCWLNVENLYYQVKGSMRSSSVKKEPFETFKRQQIINPDAAEMGLNFVDISIKVDINATSEIEYADSVETHDDFVSNRSDGVENELIGIHEQITDLSLKVEDLVGNSIAHNHLDNSQNNPILFYVSVEKAMNLPLGDDPLAQSMSSPFVQTDEIKTAPPNASVSISVPEKFREEFSIIWTDTKPRNTAPCWNFQTLLHLDKDLETFKILKNNSHLEFKVWDFQESGEGYMTASRSRVRKSLIGTATVNLEPLFVGLPEIYGWYPIRNHYGLCEGQLLVKVDPSEDMTKCMKDLSVECWTPKDTLTSGNALKLETGMEDPIPTKPIEETWVWDGKEWVHKRVIHAVENADTSQTKNNLDATSSPQFTFSQTEKQLETLTRRLVDRFENDSGNGPNETTNDANNSNPFLDSLVISLENVSLN